MDFNTKLHKLEDTLMKDIALLSLIISVNECDADPDSINGIKKVAQKVKKDLLKCHNISEQNREFLEDKGIIRNRVKEALAKI